MWIEPNGVVRLLSGVPFNIDYENTLYFANRTVQYNYFVSKTKVYNGISMVFSKVSYQRYQRNYIKLEVNSEAVYDCNYLMFQNTSFGDRWFYAFITGIEYIANQVTRIEYAIDDIQTWFWDCTMHPCFVEREHPASDVIGNNRVEENIDYGEYYLRNFEPSKLTVGSNPEPRLGLGVIVVAVDKLSSDVPMMQYYVYGGVGTGLYYFVYEESADGVISVNDLIDRYVNGRFSGCNKDDIISIFQAPKVMFVDYDAVKTSGGSQSWMNNRFMSTQSWSSTPRTYNHNIKIPTSIGSYTPRNKKLLQYPYNFLYVSDCRANSGTYKYEDFVPIPVVGGDVIQFQYVMQGSCDSSILIQPLNYKGLTGYNVNEKMIYKGYPQNAWSADLWQAYIAQNGGVIPVFNSDFVAPAVDLVTSVANNSVHRKETMDKIDEAILGRKHMTGDIYERERMGKEGNITGSSVVARTISTLGKNIAKRLMGNEAKGNYNGDIIYGAGLHDFYFGQMSVTNEYAQRLDEFFDLYGYKTNRVKVPDISSRKHWNYIKTVSLQMDAPIPQENANNIISIFENGIRFWKDPSDNCNYSQALALDNVGY